MTRLRSTRHSIDVAHATVPVRTPLPSSFAGRSNQPYRPVCLLLLTLTGTCILFGSTSNAQTVKINVFTAKSPQVGINGGFNVQTSGALTNLTGLTYRDTYSIADVFDDEQNALAMNWNALGVIGESTMLVDEYEVTADNVTLLDEPGCREFFDKMDEAPDYYRFDNSLKNTTAFIGVHRGKWLVLLPRGYRVNEQVTGYGTVYSNNSAFVNDGIPAKALIGDRRGSCGIRWVPGGGAVGPTQTILIEFGEPGAAGTTNSTTVQTNSTSNSTTGVSRNATNTTASSNTTSAATAVVPALFGSTTTISNMGWTSLMGVGAVWVLLSSWN